MALPALEDTCRGTKHAQATNHAGVRCVEPEPHFSRQRLGLQLSRPVGDSPKARGYRSAGGKLRGMAAGTERRARARRPGREALFFGRGGEGEAWVAACVSGPVLWQAHPSPERRQKADNQRKRRRGWSCGDLRAGTSDDRCVCEELKKEQRPAGPTACKLHWNRRSGMVRRRALSPKECNARRVGGHAALHRRATGEGDCAAQ
eukprot:scaffold13502_cov109-Isochrysis_galbana.AAC.2